MLKTVPKRKITLSPGDAGKRMSLDRFDRAIGLEGYTFELNKGTIEVSDVPHPAHLMLLVRVRDQLIRYQNANADRVACITGSNESKVLIAGFESERHPDLSVYFTAPPDVQDVWSVWKPAIVVEVISKSSAKRDYEDKPDEYLAFGIDEYWIVDGFKQQMTAMTRWRGQWKPKTLKASQTYTTALLPGFTLELKRVFAAGK